METDWENYRQLEEGEIIAYGDEILTPDSDHEWDELPACKIGTPAPDPYKQGHCHYRRYLYYNEV